MRLLLAERATTVRTDKKVLSVYRAARVERERMGLLHCLTKEHLTSFMLVVQVAQADVAVTVDAVATADAVVQGAMARLAWLNCAHRSLLPTDA